MAAVRAPNRARDAADEPARRGQPLQRIDQSEREHLVAQAQTLLDRHHAGSGRISRALASYSEVADSGERSGLQDLLGFDAYA